MGILPQIFKNAEVIVFQAEKHMNFARFLILFYFLCLMRRKKKKPISI